MIDSMRTNTSWRKRLAIILTVAGLLLYLLAAVLAYLSRSAPRPAGLGPWYNGLVTSLPLLLGLILGGMLVVKLPSNPYGWVWILLGLSFGSVLQVTQYYAIVALMVMPDSLPFGWAAASLAALGWFVGLCMIPLVLLLFPTGRSPTRHWRILLWIVVAALIVGFCTGWSVAAERFVPLDNPRKISGAWSELLKTSSDVAVAVIFVSIPLSLISLLHRYRLADQTERKQLKWFAYGAVLFVLALGSDFLYTAPGFWEPLKEALFFAILPATIGIAILRHQLWDIDVVIRKTLVYAVLTALLALVYFGSVVLLQRLIGSLTGVEQSPLAVVVSTLAIAALFTPLRRRIQNAIDRRFYRKKYDAQQVLAQFALTARDETDLDALLAELVRVVDETLQPEFVSIWLRAPAVARGESANEQDR